MGSFLRGIATHSRATGVALALLLAALLAACGGASTPPAVAPSVSASLAEPTAALAPPAVSASATEPPAPSPAPAAAPAAPEPASNDPVPVVPGNPLGSPVSNAATTSSVAVPEADRVIVSLRPKLRRCYDTTKGKGPDVAGMVTCGVRITKTGKVAAVGVVRRSRLPNPLVDCITKELASASFEPRESDAVIMVPVRFALADDSGN